MTASKSGRPGHEGDPVALTFLEILLQMKSEFLRPRTPHPLLGVASGAPQGVGRCGPTLGSHVPRARAVLGAFRLVLLLLILLPR